jgi:hypothetical protein
MDTIGLGLKDGLSVLRYCRDFLAIWSFSEHTDQEGKTVGRHPHIARINDDLHDQCRKSQCRSDSLFSGQEERV